MGRGRLGWVVTKRYGFSERLLHWTVSCQQEYGAGPSEGSLIVRGGTHHSSR